MKLGSFGLLASLPPLPTRGRSQAAPLPLLPSPAPSVRPNAINVSLEDRWLILGTTGTGKTTFSKELLRTLSGAYPDVPVYILDSKAVGDFEEWGDSIVADAAVPKAIPHGVQVWQPGVDDLKAFEVWFDAIRYAPGPALVLVDEVSSLVRRSGADAPPAFQKLLKQGRALGKLVISCSQEIPYVPRQIKTQATHLVRFRLAGEYDPSKANYLLGRGSKDPEPTAKHGFFYCRADQIGKVTEYSSFHDFF